MADTVEKVVIIGSGPAGWTAAIYASRANLSPLVFEGAISEENRIKGTLPLGQLALTTEVENYPGFPEGIDGPALMDLFRKQAKRFETRIKTDDIVKVDFSKRPFTLTAKGGDTVVAHTVVLAMGARANYLGLKSEERYKNQGVSACAVCDGALPRFRDQDLIVVGGGDSAIEEGTYLTKFAKTVHLLHRRDQLRASKIMQQRAFDNPKMEIHWHTELDEVLGTDAGGVTGVRVKNNKTNKTEEIPATGVFLAIGHTPNTDFLEGQVELDEKHYIKWTTVNRTYTSVDGVFAAGDAADNYFRQAISAAGTGCMAALDAERFLAVNDIE